MAERSLLIEIGVEELPIHAVDDLARAFTQGVCDGLSKRGIAADVEHAQPFATPRRLAVLVPGVAFTQPEQRNESFGPYVNIALDANGQPTKALLGFANKVGVEWTRLERATPKANASCIAMLRRAALPPNSRRKSCANPPPHFRSRSRCAGAITISRSCVLCIGW